MTIKTWETRPWITLILRSCTLGEKWVTDATLHFLRPMQMREHPTKAQTITAKIQLQLSCCRHQHITTQVCVRVSMFVCVLQRAHGGGVLYLLIAFVCAFVRCSRTRRRSPHRSRFLYLMTVVYVHLWQYSCPRDRPSNTSTPTDTHTLCRDIHTTKSLFIGHLCGRVWP